MTPATIDIAAVSDRIRDNVLPGEGRIPIFIYSDPAVYALELQRVFGRSWLFVAHESEIPTPGSWVQRTMGEQSVIVARGEDGVIRTFLNSCRHRGMKLACEDFGEGRMWRCQYHGFAYASTGEFMGTLVGAPYERIAYPGGLNRAALHLIEARTERYQGLIFANWDPGAPSLEEWLGPMRWYLDIFCGRAEMEIVGVPQKWVIPCAWKFPAENFTSDAYHTATAHAFLAKLDLVKGVDFGRDGYHVDPGNGCGLGIGIHPEEDGSYFPRELDEEYAANLDTDQLRLLHRLKNFHGNLFPNLSFLVPNFIRIGEHWISGLMLRLWQPIGPDRIETWSWHLVEKNGPDWWKRKGRATYTQTFGMSGMFDQDDTENWELQTKNANSALARDDEVWMHFEMGIHLEPLGDEFPGPGDVYDGKYSEAAGRSYYRHWRELMLEER
jgi:phenylpropionate dioxygenase-like ring-hydroxylating dioxygenase large terminal subunit